jgi:vacuolar-type H+-ATPase subunit H
MRQQDRFDEAGPAAVPETVGSIRPGMAEGAESAEELRADIAETRAELNCTVDAIQDRLSPEYLKEQAKDVMHDATDQAKEIIHDATEHAKQIVREAVNDASEQARSAVHDATIGKAEEAARTARGVSSNMFETIRQNPIPAALVGIGLGWMFFNRQNDSGDSRSSWSAGGRGWSGGATMDGQRFARQPSRYDAPRFYGSGEPSE